MVDTFSVTRTDEAAGEVLLKLNSTQTTNLEKAGLYDVKLIEPSGDEYFWLKGRYTIKQGLTDD